MSKSVSGAYCIGSLRHSTSVALRIRKTGTGIDCVDCRIIRFLLLEGGGVEKFTRLKVQLGRKYNT